MTPSPAGARERLLKRAKEIEGHADRYPSWNILDAVQHAADIRLVLAGPVEEDFSPLPLAAPPAAFSDGGAWVLVPREPTPEIIADVAVRAQDPTTADVLIAVKARALLPPVVGNHPVQAILAELARDYRAMVAAAPQAVGDR